jgi:hypothetical protein
MVVLISASVVLVYISVDSIAALECRVKHAGVLSNPRCEQPSLIRVWA